MDNITLTQEAYSDLCMRAAGYEELRNDVKEIKEALAYIGTYGLRADYTPDEARQRVHELAKKWMGEVEE